MMSLSDDIFHLVVSSYFRTKTCTGCIAAAVKHSTLLIISITHLVNNKMLNKIYVR